MKNWLLAGILGVGQHKNDAILLLRTSKLCSNSVLLKYFSSYVTVSCNICFSAASFQFTSILLPWRYLHKKLNWSTLKRCKTDIFCHACKFAIYAEKWNTNIFPLLECYWSVCSIFGCLRTWVHKYLKNIFRTHFFTNILHVYATVYNCLSFFFTPPSFCTDLNCLLAFFVLWPKNEL